MRARWIRLAWPAAAALLALAAWLLLPGGTSASRGRALCALLLDVSASVAREPAWLPWARAELAWGAREALERGEELLVLSFADGVATAFPSGEATGVLEALQGRGGPPLDLRARLPDSATRLAHTAGCAYRRFPAARLCKSAPQ